jgi:transcriptional regulator with XRE-family HTH domain
VPFIDRQAGERLTELLELIGVSPETMAVQISLLARKKDWRNGTIDASTIRRAERGLVPTRRSRFVIAQYLGVPLDEIWDRDRWVKVENTEAASR